MEYHHTVLVKDRYQIVALTREDDPGYAPDEVIAYQVLTDSGARLREVASLEQARLYLDDLLARDGDRDRDWPAAPPRAGKRKPGRALRRTI
ncbi:MAG: hypothetical protein QM601_01775 [Pseudoxanthomonas sp.]